MRSQLSLDLPSPTAIPLESKMAEFKEDPQKMDEVARFIDEVLLKAQDEAGKKLNAKTEPTEKTTRGEMLDGLKKGEFLEEKELKCYTVCIAQMMGVLTKKGDLSVSKTIAQIGVLTPPEIKERSVASFLACKSVRNNNIFNGLKRGRIATRARGMVLRLFEAICNCTNTGPIPTPRATPSTSKY